MLRRHRYRFVGWLAPLLVVSCAQPYPPPGGPQDREAPRLLSTQPEQQAVLDGWDGPVVFRFDETLSEEGVRDAVVVSPETGRVSVQRDGSVLKVNVRGGWKANTIYRIVVLPTLRDRFRNIRREYTELVFSTGPTIHPTAVAGLVTDRITGRALPDMRVTAALFPDSLTPQATVTDTAGFFGLRYLPLGRYTIRAFEDRNRNRKLDEGERFAERSLVIGTTRDTQVVEFALLAPDTTPARLLRAELRDSLQVRLGFDDHLDPEKPLTQAAVIITQLPDSVPVAGGQLMHVQDFQKQRARADTSAAQPTMRAQRTESADSVALPTQELVLSLPAPLLPGTRYRVDVSGIVNLNEVPNGGGSARFETPRRDTTSTPRDTTQVRRDTVGVR